MTKHLPPYDAIPAAWASLPPETQAEVGRLALRAALSRTAAEEYQGNVVYLDDEARDEADQTAWTDLGALITVLGDALPDLYGANPSDEHPNGTDPTWAVPRVWEPSERITIEWVEEAEAA